MGDEPFVALADRFLAPGAAAVSTLRPDGELLALAASAAWARGRVAPLRYAHAERAVMGLARGVIAAVVVAAVPVLALIIIGVALFLGWLWDDRRAR